MKKKLNTLNEQLSRMKKLMKFKIGENSHDILSENFINEQKPVDPKDLENIKPSDSKIIGLGTDPEKKEKPKVKSTQTTTLKKDWFKGTIEDIYKSLGTCKGILLQVRNLAVTIGSGKPLSLLKKEGKTYDFFIETMKNTQEILGNEISKGEKNKNSPLVGKILKYSKNSLDKSCVKKLQEQLLKYTESKNEIETPEGKKEYTDGIVGLLTLKGYVDAEIAYYDNVFSKWDGIKNYPYGKINIDTKKGDSSKGLESTEVSSGDIGHVAQKTKTKQSLKN